MKKTIVSLLLSLICLNSFSQKTILNPKFDATNSPNVQITKITLCDTATILDFKVTFTPKMWIIFAKDNYIESSDGKIKLHSKAVKGYQGNLDDKWFMPDSGVVHFSLIYPKIDLKTAKIDFIESEKSEKAFKILGIHINYKSSVSENLTGNWQKTDGSNIWSLGIYDKLVIYKNDIWHYKSVTKSGKTTKLVLTTDKKTIALTLYPAGSNKLMISEGTKPMRLYSKTKTYNKTYEAKGEPAFNNLPYGNKQTIIRGFLDGYNPKLGYKTQMLYLQNSLTREDIPAMVYINPDGTFESRFDLPYPQIIFAYFGDGSVFQMYLEPGDRSIVYLSLKDQKVRTAIERTSIERSTCFMGSHAMESSNLLAMDHFAFSNYEKYDSEEILSPQEFKANRVHEWLADKDTLKSISLRLSITPKALQLKNFQIDLTRSIAILDYLWHRQSAASKDSTKRVNVENSYYDFLKSDFKNATLLPQLLEFSTFINRLEYSNFYFSNIPDLRNVYSKVYLSNYKGAITKTNYENWFPLLESMGVKITPEEKEMASWFKGPYNSILADTLNVNKFMPIISEFEKKNKSNMSCLDLINKIEYQRSLSKNLFDTDSQFIQEVTTLRSLNNKMVEILTEPQLNKLLTYYDTPFLKAELIRINNSKIALANRNTTKPKDPVTKADKIFQNIASKYKGNIVLIDFWSTSCGPCRAEMTEHKNLPDELKDKKIKLVYITDEYSSPLQTYTDFTKNIKGEHYRITRDEWNQLAVQFKINGIPRYMLLNKFGAIIEDTANYWGNNLKTRLLELEKD